jgi:hypothetical protein
LRRAKSAAEFGLVRSYFMEQMDWEAAMRQQFHNLARRPQGREECQQAALAALNQLNRRYKTRFKSSSLPILRDELLAPHSRSIIVGMSRKAAEKAEG